MENWLGYIPPSGKKLSDQHISERNRDPLLEKI
jgi:hypothetical protein